MNMRMYKATGFFIAAFKWLVGFRVRVSGGEHLPDRPILFVVNHFTRFETVMVPYAVYLAARRKVRTLATPSIFKGLLGKYLHAVGVMSIRDPRRNRTIISELMTGRCDWVIYPEGGLIKNKRTTRKGRLHLERPDRAGPPHTGAAMLALKAEICKRRYLQACARHDERRRAYYEEQFDITAPEDLAAESPVIVPMNITYHAYRPRSNLIQRAARFLSRAIDPRFEEEMTVEGSILLGRAEMSVHFAEPIEIAAYLDRATALARRIAGVFSEDSRTALGLRRQATRLTRDAMYSIYSHLEINFEHLFCYGLASLKRDSILVDDFRRALFLATVELAGRYELRLHPELRDGVTELVTGNGFAALKRAESRAVSEEVLEVTDGRYVINRRVLREDHDFHRIRLERMVRVLANEFESIPHAAALVRRLVNLSPSRVASRVSRALRRRDRSEFARDYRDWFEDGASKEADHGEPFFLRSRRFRPARPRLRRARRGIVLVHGYLASPRQMRPLAEFLRKEGWNVYAVRLPGHGTSPRQLEDVRWQEWLGAVMRGYAVMKQHCERTVLAGFSLGGVLALLAAARLGETGDAVVAINAPIKLRDRRAWLVNPVIGWRRTLSRLGLGNGELSVENESEDPQINYPAYSLRSVRELRRAVAACHDRLSEVTVPALIIQATDDPVVEPSSARSIWRRLRSGIKEIITPEFDRHVIVRGEGSEAVFREISRFLDRAERGGEIWPGDGLIPIRT